jgi:hypothetical protein
MCDWRSPCVSLQKLVTQYGHIDFPQGIPPELRLGPVFDEHSDYFKNLKAMSLDVQYWHDLVHAHPGNNVGLHFMVKPESAYHLWF